MAMRPRKTEAKASTEKGTKANAKANGKAVVPKTAAKTTVGKPRVTKTEPPVVTEEMIAERAYYIALSGTGAGEHENWLRAEVELRGGA